MQTFAIVLVFMAMLMGVVAAAGVIKPIPKILPTRKRAALTLAGCTVLFFIGGVIGAATDPNQKVADSKARVVQASAPSKVAVNPKVQLGKEARALWASVIDIAQNCDSASKRIAKVADGGDVYRMYDEVKAGESACHETSSALGNLSPPESAIGEVKTAFKNAINRCENGYLMKSIAYSKMLKVIDGDVRPSAVSEARENMQDANVMTLGCGVSIMTAASKGGLSLDIFGNKK